MLKGIVGFGCGLALILSSPIVWSEQNVYDIQTIKEVTCSGSMIPDTNVGGNITTINEVSDDQKATFFFS